MAVFEKVRDGGKTGDSGRDVMNRADFAADLARRRADAGMSLAEVAARAHVNRGYVHRVERGERWPSRTVARALDAALARLGDGPAVRAALRRCASALDRQSQDRPPDHHFFFDGNKFELYTGTALAWLGDPAAEDYARHAAARYDTGNQLRRLATAYLDLGLVLARLGGPDEAAHCGVLALGANHLVPFERLASRRTDRSGERVPRCARSRDTA